MTSREKILFATMLMIASIYMAMSGCIGLAILSVITLCSSFLWIVAVNNEQFYIDNPQKDRRHKNRQTGEKNDNSIKY